jgi:hypothetical protein
VLNSAGGREVTVVSSAAPTGDTGCLFEEQCSGHNATWAHALAVGQALPTLPLWLADNLAVPLELEASYEETCRILRIP